jgi:hypothetical protein
MLLHPCPLFLGERALLEKYPVRRTDLANIMDAGRRDNQIHFGSVEIHRTHDLRGVVGDALRISAGVGIAQVDSIGPYFPGPAGCSRWFRELFLRPYTEARPE